MLVSCIIAEGSGRFVITCVLVPIDTNLLMRACLQSMVFLYQAIMHGIGRVVGGEH